MAKSPCLNHEGVPAVAHCRKCHKPICADCIVRGGQDVFCSTECREQYANFKDRYPEEKPRRKRSLLGQLAILVGAVLIFLLAVKIGAARNVPIFLKLDRKIFGTLKEMTSSHSPQGRLEEPTSGE